MSLLPFQLGCAVVTERGFRYRGETRVRPGQLVDADSVVGIEPAPLEPLIVDLASTLATSPEAAAEAVLVEVGQRVAQGMPLARSLDPARPREVLAPRDGLFSAYDASSGLATLLVGTGEMELRAHVPGVVSAIVPGRAVRIQTFGALAVGAWGVGGEAFGVLRVATSDPSRSAGPEAIDHRFTYSILFAGRTLSAATLSRCVEFGIRGVIAGGMLAGELGRFLGAQDGSLQLPDALRELRPGGRRPIAPPVVMLLEGFGEGGVRDEAWELLSACDGREGSLSAPGWPRGPRLVMQLPRSEVPDPAPPREATITPGSAVRILGGSHGGSSAQVLRIPAQRVALPSGVRAEAALVHTREGEDLLVPIVNLRPLSNA